MENNKDITKLINQLNNFKTRSLARRTLATIGNECCASLLEALIREETSDNMCWALMNLLADYEYKPAIKPIFKKLITNNNLKAEAGMALKKMTGYDHGIDIENWAKELKIEVADFAPNDEPIADFAPLVINAKNCEVIFKKALGNLASKCEWVDDSYLYLKMLLAGNRKQQIVITFYDDENGINHAKFYTECGSAPAEISRLLQECNTALEFGQYELLEGDEESIGKVIMKHFIACSMLSSHKICEVCTFIASNADAMEAKLGGGCDRI